jgi:hypothetical protein
MRVVFQCAPAGLVALLEAFRTSERFLTVPAMQVVPISSARIVPEGQPVAKTLRVTMTVEGLARIVEGG